MLEEKRYGEYFADGGVRMPEVSALSGKPVAPGDVYVRLSKHHFVMVRAVEKAGLSSVDWNALKETWRSQFEGVKPAEGPGVVASPLPVFEEMSLAEIRKYAEDNGIDITGKKGQKQIAAAVRAHHIMQQYDAPANVSAPTAPATVPTPTAAPAEGTK